MPPSRHRTLREGATRIVGRLQKAGFPAFFVGGTFPLALFLYADRKDDLNRSSGVLYFWDTFGGIVGALLCGFVFIPYLGLKASIFIAGVTVSA